MNIALFTSNHLRHKYIAFQIAEKLSLKLIVCEDKSEAIENSSQYDENDRQLLKEHFENRSVSEQCFFGKYLDFPSEIEVAKVKFGEINSQNTLDLLDKYKVDCILLFGTSIIKPIILNRYLNNVINLHLGLSPYYKGSGTNFFPIVNSEFECIGATIHLAINKVDAGDILHQIRPDISNEKDDIYSLGNKVIEEAGLIYPKVVEKYLLGKIEATCQKITTENKEYKLKDFTPEALRIANRIIEKGELKNFIKNKKNKLELKPIITNYNE
jgi:folate-dependent phosphoribosylglycinamide formyltransferase PurN